MLGGRHIGEMLGGKKIRQPTWPRNGIPTKADAMRCFRNLGRRKLFKQRDVFDRIRRSGIQTCTPVQKFLCSFSANRVLRSFCDSNCCCYSTTTGRAPKDPTPIHHSIRPFPTTTDNPHNSRIAGLESFFDIIFKLLNVCANQNASNACCGET